MKHLKKLCLALACLLLLCVPAIADSTITLPADLTEIKAEAFLGDVSISEVVVPEGVKTIGARAFANSGLSKITLPKSLKSIASDAFKNCKNITITTPEGSYALKWAQENGFNVHVDCDFEYTIGSSGVTLTAYTGSAKAVTVPSVVAGQKVVALDYTFYNNKTVTSVSLPASVQYINYAFYNCTALTKISVASGNNVFTDRDGVLFRVGVPDYTTPPYKVDQLVCYPAGRKATSYEIPSGTIDIMENAFSGCRALKEIYIPDTLESISEFAFDNTPSLERFTVSNINYEFSAGSGGVLLKDGDPLELFCYPSGKTDTSYKVDQYVTKIGNQAFMNNPYLESITLPSGTTSIPSYAFTNYTALKTLTIPEGVTRLDSTICNGCTSLTRVELPETLETFEWENFVDCPNLTYINLPASLTYIGKMNFVNCPKLTVHVDEGSLAHEWCIENGVKFSTDTEPNAASDFTVKNLTSTTCAITGYSGERTKVVIPSKIGSRTVTTIAQDAFYNNTHITAVTIPSTVTTLEARAFYNCHHLTKVVLNEGLKTIDTFAFDNCRFTEISIPDSVTTISGGAFSYCSLLEDIKLPKGITTIEGETFIGCNALKSITIPSSVTTIKQFAFQGAGLTSITIPSSVKTIGRYAFYNCWDLSDAYIPKTVTSIGDGAFLSQVKIHAPKGSYAAKWAASNGNTVVYN